MISRISLILLFSLAFSTIGCGGGKQTNRDPETLKIALVCPMTGNLASLGESAKAGCDLALAEINETGGIDGKPLSLVVEDDKGDPREAANVAQKLSADESILAVVGHFNSSCTLAGAPIYNRSGLVELSYGSTNPKITEAGAWTFRNCVTDDFQGAFMANYVVKQQKKKKIAVMFDNDDYGRGLMEVFTASAKQLGANIVAIESFARGASTDFTAQLTKIHTQAPDALFISGVATEAALIATQSKQIGLEVPMFGADGLFAEDLIKLGGDAVAGIVFSGFFHYTSSNPKAKVFVKRYREKFGSNPLLPKDPDAWSAQAYDAVYLLKIAIENGGTERKAIRDALAAIGQENPPYQGVTGTNGFDKNGDMKKSLTLLTVKKGTFTSL